ncbi:MAG: HAD family hydrolase [Brasilonema angustatum HA4187-MV1]|nr:HAD family hydrolase [Brasilonema angustatum HA4187-MV1]
MMKNSVIFDLDGTLIDTPRAIVETFAATFVSIGAPVCEAKDIRATIGLPLEQAFSKLIGVPLNNNLVSQGVQQYLVLFKELILPKAEELIFPGVKDGLTAFLDQGFLLAVATSKFQASAEALLQAAGLHGYFSIVVGADQVAQPKPNPESGYLIMEKLGVQAEQTVMVGDTTHDMLMAKAAGINSLAVTYGVHNLEKLKSSYPTWIVDTFDDVVATITVANQRTDRRPKS